jgi:hypothetical protein
MASKPAWLFWVRGILLSAISGHAVANALFDADEYHHAGLSYSWSAYIPMAIQALVVVGAWWGLGRVRWRPHPTLEPTRHLRRLLAALIASQLVLFMFLEITERIAQRDPFAEGLFGSSFLFELSFAIGSALVLIALGFAVLRLVRSVRRQQPVVVAQIRTPSRPVVVALVRRTSRPGGTRAPPLVLV